MKAVYKKELKAYFQSIIGCVFIAFLIAFTGIYFMAYNMTTGYPYFSYTLSGSLIGLRCVHLQKRERIKQIRFC